MKILHLSDFHFKNVSKNIAKQRHVIEKFIENKEALEGIDLIVFTGDLVQNGIEKKSFLEAKKLVIDSFCENLNFNPKNVIICPGNHDVNREEALDAITEKIDRITNNHDLNTSLSSKELEHSCAPINNYFDFLNENFDYSEDVVEKFYTVHKRFISGTETSIITINTAWRSIGKNDENNLLFPTDQLMEALRHVKKEEYKILLMHHPLSDFRSYNSSELEDIIHSNFDLVLSGHIHKANDSIQLRPTSSVIKIGAPAALTYGHDAQVGIGTIELDFDNSQFHIHKYLWDSQNDFIYAVPKGPFEIPSDSKKKELNKFRAKLKGKFELELESARNLFVSKDSDILNKSLSDICADPVLKTTSSTEINSGAANKDFDWNDLNNPSTDYLVLGSGKCGKTVLLKKIQLDLLRGYSHHRIVPFYMDCKDFSNKDTPFVLETEFRRYFDLSRADAEKIFLNENVLLLIDNYDEKSITFINNLSTQIGGKNNIRIVATSTETSVASIEEAKINERVFSKLYFHKLRKKHIRQLTDKIQSLPSAKKEEIVDKIHSIFTKLSIPFNFWTVSLFLWIFKKDLNGNFRNDVELINLYVEKLLEKEQLTIDGGDFGFEKYKRYLAHLAYFLLSEHHKTGYKTSYSKLYSFTEEYLIKNPRYNVSARTVLTYIEDKGIIENENANTNINLGFRLNGVFEYFVAHYMSIDEKFRKICVQDDNFYLSFANEFELYAGFKRDDEKFLTDIFDKTKEIFQKTNANYKDSSLDVLLQSKIVQLTNLKPVIDKISEKLQNGLSLDEQDKLEEDILAELDINSASTSEVIPKKVQELDDSIESLEKSLTILGGVYKNIDEIGDEQKVYEIFDFIIDSACHWGFKIMDDIKLNDIAELIDIEDGEAAKDLLKLITNFIPTLVQSRLNEVIGNKNIERIILEKLNDFSGHRRENQYKLFLYTFLLCDINLSKHKSLIDGMIDDLRINILKYSSSIKLNFFLGFKTSQNKELAKYLREKVIKQELSFDKTTDKGALQKMFAQQKKGSMLNKDK